LHTIFAPEKGNTYHHFYIQFNIPMLFSDEYKTILEPAQGTFRDKGSRFLAFSFPVTNEKEIKFNLEALRKQYYDATHHCYAYIIGSDKSAFGMNYD